VIGQVFDPFKGLQTGDDDDFYGGLGGLLGNDATTPVGPTRQYVSFSVGRGAYAVDILSIREFKRWAETTALPNTPPYVHGVINLRGVVVPVYDLKARFGQGHTLPTSTHVIMMVAITQAATETSPPRERTVGLLVDGVDDVLTLPLDALTTVPETDAAAHPFVEGVLTVGERMIAVLDLDCLLSHEEFPELLP
jgi:purine-binding chemotaxis protein CheW